LSQYVPMSGLIVQGI